MTRWMALVTSLGLGIPAISAPAQGQQEIKKFEVTLTQIEVKGSGGDWNINLEVETTFPAEAVLSFVPKMRKHYYMWREKEFQFGNFDRVATGATAVTVAGRKFKPPPLRIVLPGIYELTFWFDPNAQSKGDVIRKAMGKSNYYRRDFPVVVVAVGDPKAMMQTLMNDTDHCREMIKKILELLNRIEKESEDKNWEAKSQEIFKEINQLKAKAAERAEKTLHHAVYKMLDDILGEVALIGAQIKLLNQMGKPAAGGGGAKPTTGGTGGNSDEPAQQHNNNGDPSPVLAGIDGKTLSMKKAKEHVETCDTIRLREYFSWETILLADVMTRLNDSYAAIKAPKPEATENERFKKIREEARKVNEETEKAHRHLTSDSHQKESFETISTYEIEGAKEPQKFADFFRKFAAYESALVDDSQKGSGDIPESIKTLQAEIKRHLDAAKTKALGAKSKTP